MNFWLLFTPIGILGVVGYLVLLIGWISSKTIHGCLGDWGAGTAFAVAFGRTLFSIYLTFLEPYVIAATCMWCLASALCIVGLLGSSGMGSGRSPSGVTQCRRVGPPMHLQDQVFDLSGYT